METITAGGRRTLPPVPRSVEPRDTHPPLLRRPPVPEPQPVLQPAPPRDDPGQDFVAALRAAAAGFAAAAGVTTALVAEAVPPARHRRARCRVVLLGADGTGSDVAFLGAAGTPTSATVATFIQGITGWLAGMHVGPTAATVPGSASAAPVDVTG